MDPTERDRFGSGERLIGRERTSVVSHGGLDYLLTYIERFFRRKYQKDSCGVILSEAKNLSLGEFH